LGFDQPRLVVQVKSGDQQQDVKVLRELKGVLHDHKAEHGLLVAWGGFKRTVLVEARKEFFQVRLWDAQAVINEVLKSYEQLPEKIKVDLPLRKIWILVNEPD
jgi:restriction system protein